LRWKVEEDDDVVSSHWSTCECEDNDTWQHLVGQIWKVRIMTCVSFWLLKF